MPLLTPDGLGMLPAGTAVVIQGAVRRSLSAWKRSTARTTSASGPAPSPPCSPPPAPSGASVAEGSLAAPVVGDVDLVCAADRAEGAPPVA